ncbi:MAG: hypothetical protein JWM05_327, partial [Acidimicrobiales bacterium]|nr:hypothetical protein [Acidimicrobiales bacterium]
VAFAHAGTAVGPPTPTHPTAPDDPRITAFRARLGEAAICTAAAWVDDRLVAVASTIRCGPAAEVVGVGTLPAFRRRGLGAAATARAVDAARRQGADIVFLSAEDDAVARIYERLGFHRVATSAAAEPPATDHP